MSRDLASEHRSASERRDWNALAEIEALQEIEARDAPEEIDTIEDAPALAGRLDLFEDKAGWLAARGRLITSSRGPSIIGVGYGSAFRLNLELRGRAEQLHLEGDGLELGHEIEPALLNMLERRIPGLRVWKPAPYMLVRSSEFPWLAASPDAFAEHPDWPGLGVVELKTTAAVRRSDWLEDDDTVTVPPYPRVQLNHHALAAGLSWGIVACAIGLGIQARFVCRVVKHDAKWCRESYLPRISEFWSAVEADEDWPADAHVETGRTLRALYPKEATGKVIALPPEAMALCDEYEDAAAQAREWKAAKEEAKARLQALMGDAGTGLVDSERYVTWLESPRRGYVVSPGRARVLRVRRR